MIDALRPDLRGTELWTRVSEHFDTLYAPGFGEPGEPSDPTISPDGTALACTVTIRTDLESPPRHAVLVVAPDGSRLIEMRGGSVRMPRWAPVGDDIAVIVDDGTALPHPALVVTGRVVDLPPLPGTTEQLIWSPDGEQLLALVADPGADAAGAQGSGRTGRGDAPPWLPTVMADVPVGGWRRLHSWHRGDDTWTPRSPDGITCWEAAWAGPGRVVAVASSRPEEFAWFSARLVEITPELTTRVLLTADHRCLGLPAVSPDGRHVAFVRATCSDRTVVAGDVTVIGPSGEATELDLGLDVTWQGFRGDHLVAAGQRGQSTVVDEIDLTSGAVTERWSSFDLTCGQRYPELAVSPGGIAAVVEGYRHPPELAVLDLDGPRLVTSLHHEGHRRVLERCGELRPVRWTAPDGTDIEGLVVVPPGAGPHPLITYVHGGPVWAWRSRWSMGYPYTALFARMGFAVFHPNPRGSSGRGEAFRTAVLGDLGGAEADDILTGIDHLVATGVADPRRLGVYGGSHGGFMASWLVTVTDRFAAAVPYCPVTDWPFMRLTTNDMAAQDHLLAGRPGRSPLDHTDRVSTPTLVITGTRDLITPASQGLAFHRALALRGVTTGYVEYPLEGHGVRTFPAQVDVSARTLGWFEHFMGPDGDDAGGDR